MEKSKTSFSEGDYCEFKGTTQEAISDIREDVKFIRARMETLCVDHEARIKSMEASARVFKWLYGALLAFLAYMGVKP